MVFSVNKMDCNAEVWYLFPRRFKILHLKSPGCLASTFNQPLTGCMCINVNECHETNRSLLILVPDIEKCLSVGAVESDT